MKVAIITGSSNGIGRQIALEFAKDNYNIIINYNKSKTQAFNLAEQIKRLGRNCITVQADVSKLCEAQNLIDKSLNAFGKIDILVNNAGISLQKIFQDVSEDEWKNLFAVNLGSVFNCCSCVLNDMLLRKKGKIINISSIWGMVGASMEVHYSASKAAIIGLTKALAKELGPSGINVNCIAPGVIDTNMNSFDNEIISKLKNDTPLGRIGTTLDVAKTALFLASDDSDFITGQVISPNGGFVI
ncbi:MAG: 3-oxoacyl-ACP reductase FabG [Clostridia bacterium]|nr:3-oxoacyl-ACP reductase FabG [Clostridia bacterium]